MTVRAGYGRRWAGRRASVLAGLLALAVVLPVGVLFVAHWRHLDERRSVAEQERDGIAYILTLGELTVALADAQSAAVNGQAVPRHTLTRAVDATTEVDARLGEPYQVSERWAQLRSLIESLADTQFSDPRLAYAGYVEAADLLLDLYTKLRETSGLIRDVDADTYYLQDGAAEELPEAIVAASRLVDLVTIATTEQAAAEAAGQSSSQPGDADQQFAQPGDPGQSGQEATGGQDQPAGPDPAQMAAATAELSVARVAVMSPSDDLAVDLQAALDSTQSRTLSSRVLSSFDSFLREKDALLAAVPPGGAPGELDLEALDRLRVDLQAAATDLFGALMGELDALIETRIESLQRAQLTALGAAAAVVVLILAVTLVTLLGARSRGRHPAGEPEPAPQRGPVNGAPPAEVVQAELVEWERSGAR